MQLELWLEVRRLLEEENDDLVQKGEALVSEGEEGEGSAGDGLFGYLTTLVKV